MGRVPHSTANQCGAGSDPYAIPFTRKWLWYDFRLNTTQFPCLPLPSHSNRQENGGDEYHRLPQGGGNGGYCCPEHDCPFSTHHGGGVGEYIFLRVSYFPQRNGCNRCSKILHDQRIPASNSNPTKPASRHRKIPDVEKRGQGKVMSFPVKQVYMPPHLTYILREVIGYFWIPICCCMFFGFNIVLAGGVS